MLLRSDGGGIKERGHLILVGEITNASHLQLENMNGMYYLGDPNHKGKIILK
jgi:hypothetical protein